MTNKGFTLTELMITVAIIGILAAIATPIYTGYTERGRLADAYAACQTVAMGEEKHFAERNTYLAFDDTNTLNSMGLSNLGTLSAGTILINDFTITITATATQFVVNAIPRTSRVKSDRRPCMRSDGRQGFTSDGAYDSCSQSDWK